MSIFKVFLSNGVKKITFSLKGYPKMKILSSFTHHCTFLMWNTKYDILKNVGNQTGTH